MNISEIDFCLMVALDSSELLLFFTLRNLESEGVGREKLQRRLNSVCDRKNLIRLDISDVFDRSDGDLGSYRELRIIPRESI
jgi:predicted protein tyrosine phosphatase